MWATLLIKFLTMRSCVVVNLVTLPKKKLNTIVNFKIVIQNTLLSIRGSTSIIIYKSNIFLTIVRKVSYSCSTLPKYLKKKGFFHYSNSPKNISGIYKINSRIYV